MVEYCKKIVKIDKIVSDFNKKFGVGVGLGLDASAVAIDGCDDKIHFLSESIPADDDALKTIYKYSATQLLEINQILSAPNNEYGIPIEVAAKSAHVTNYGGDVFERRDWTGVAVDSGNEDEPIAFADLNSIQSMYTSKYVVTDKPSDEQQYISSIDEIYRQTYNNHPLRGIISRVVAENGVGIKMKIDKFDYSECVDVVSVNQHTHDQSNEEKLTQLSTPLSSPPVSVDCIVLPMSKINQLKAELSEYFKFPNLVEKQDYYATKRNWTIKYSGVVYDPSLNTYITQSDRNTINVDTNLLYRSYMMINRWLVSTLSRPQTYNDLQKDQDALFSTIQGFVSDQASLQLFSSIVFNDLDESIAEENIFSNQFFVDLQYVSDKLRASNKKKAYFEMLFGIIKNISIQCDYNPYTIDYKLQYLWAKKSKTVKSIDDVNTDDDDDVDPDALKGDVDNEYATGYDDAVFDAEDIDGDERLNAGLGEEGFGMGDLDA